MSKIIELTDEQADSIVVETLKETYEIMYSDMVKITKMNPIPKHRQEDLHDQRKMRKHIRKVLSFFMVKEEYEEWLKDTGTIND